MLVNCSLAWPRLLRVDLCKDVLDRPTWHKLNKNERNEQYSKQRRKYENFLASKALDFLSISCTARSIISFYFPFGTSSKYSEGSRSSSL